LSRDRAGFDVRDVHPSTTTNLPDRDAGGSEHRLIGSLATYGKINQYGFIETPTGGSSRPCRSTTP
jgi:DNA-directed RNA polymerase subunit beta